MIDEDSLNYIKENYELDITILSEKTGYCYQTIKRNLINLGLYKPKSKKVTPEVIQFILENPETSQKELSEKLKLSYSTVNKIRLENGIRIHAKHIFYV